MGEYEIRVLNSNGTCSAIIEQIQLNDHAAIRSAQKMARGQKFEVWRGLDCIYAGSVAVPVPHPTVRDRHAA